LAFCLLAHPALAETVEAPGAVLRLLDKLSGDVQDVTLAAGDQVRMGRMTVALDECRYPAGDPSSDGFAQLRIFDSASSDPVFRGWMIASSPALNALDHPRYDVWVLNCDVPGATPAPTTEAGEGE
jgi:hypothetical protein